MYMNSSRLGIPSLSRDNTPNQPLKGEKFSIGLVLWYSNSVVAKMGGDDNGSIYDILSDHLISSC